MSRQRSPNRDKAFEVYKNHDGNIKLKDIAENLNVSDAQIRKWKSTDKWYENLKGMLPFIYNIQQFLKSKQEKASFKFLNDEITLNMVNKGQERTDRLIQQSVRIQMIIPIQVPIIVQHRQQF